MLFVASTTAPFVPFVHIRLPLFARQSREKLLRWAKDIPPDTEIDMTTMRFFGWTRITRLRLGDLSPARKRRVGVTNLVWSPREPAPIIRRPWWKTKAPTKFYIGKDQSKSREPFVWQQVSESIAKRHAQKSARIQYPWVTK
jgi:hypothetical protein